MKDKILNILLVATILAPAILTIVVSFLCAVEIHKISDGIPESMESLNEEIDRMDTLMNQVEDQSERISELAERIDVINDKVSKINVYTSEED